MGRPRAGDENQVILCPSCGHEVPQPEATAGVDDLTGRAVPTEGVQYHCRHCGMIFTIDEAATE